MDPCSKTATRYVHVTEYLENLGFEVQIYHGKLEIFRDGVEVLRKADLLCAYAFAAGLHAAKYLPREKLKALDQVRW